MATVPAAWSKAAMATATGGPIPATAAALTPLFIGSLLMTRLKIVAVTALAMAALGSIGIITSGARRSGAPGPASPKLAAGKAANRADERKPAAKPAARGLTIEVEAGVAPVVSKDDLRRGALRVAKLKHAGDWDLAPRAIPNLMDALRKPPFNFDIALTQKDLFPRDPALIYYPLLYIQGRAPFSFPKEDLELLRRHLEPSGATLFADAACGNPVFDAAFRRFAAALFPDHKLEPIPDNDALYTNRVGFDLSGCQYTKAAGGGKGFPQLEGVKVDGHWAIIYSKFDLGCALSRQSGLDCKGYTYDSAVRIAANIVIYSTLP
jgi:hypothetical protein